MGRISKVNGDAEVTVLFHSMQLLHNPPGAYEVRIDVSCSRSVMMSRQDMLVGTNLERRLVGKIVFPKGQ